MFQTLLAAGTQDIVVYVSIGALALLAVIMTVICIANKKFDTKSIAYAAVCLATSFALSFLKIAPVPYGGSITLASFAPLLVYAYAFGPVRGFCVGLIFGLLNFISSPWLLTPMTFILDYLLAFTMIGLMGFARKLTKSLTANVVLGTAIVFIARFTMHLFAGMIYFAQGEIYTNLPQINGFVYSFLYQCVYIIPDAVIAGAVLGVLAKTGTLLRFLRLLNPKRFSVPEPATTENAPENP